MIVFRKISFVHIFGLWFLVFIFTLVTMYCQWGIEEQGDNTPLFFRAIGSLFHVFRFPTHTLFGVPSSDWFMWGLFINSWFHAFVLERSFYIIGYLKEKNRS